MAILTKKTIFQRSTTFFAHFVHFYILDFIFFFWSVPTPCQVAEQSPRGQTTAVFCARLLMRYLQSAQTRLLQILTNRVPRPTLNKNIKNRRASKNQLPTFEKKQLNKNTI